VQGYNSTSWKKYSGIAGYLIILFYKKVDDFIRITLCQFDNRHHTLLLNSSLISGKASRKL